MDDVLPRPQHRQDPALRRYRATEEGTQGGYQEDFDTVVDLYSEDAVLVIRPDKHAVGKVQIRSAMEAIAAHFDRSLDVRQAGTVILETGDTALMLARMLVSAKNFPVIERKVTYVFKKDSRDRWLCAIDNSYGHEVLDASA